MAALKLSYGSSTALTITLASLASGSARQSLAVDNSSDLFVDVLVVVQTKLGAGSPVAGIVVYAYGSENGATYGDNATGSDAAITLRTPTNLRVLGMVNTPDSGGLTYRSHPMSLAEAFGGIVPRKWGLVVHNLSGVSLTGTGGDHSCSYTGVYYSTV